MQCRVKRFRTAFASKPPLPRHVLAAACSCFVESKACLDAGRAGGRDSSAPATQESFKADFRIFVRNESLFDKSCNSALLNSCRQPGVCRQ